MLKVNVPSQTEQTKSPDPAQVVVKVDSMTAIAGALALAALVSWGKKKISTLIERFLSPKVDEQTLTSQLYQLLAQTKCDRILLIMKHNGDRFANNMSFKKLSAAFEVVRPGVSRVAHTFQNRPLSLYQKDIEALEVQQEAFTAVKLHSSLSHNLITFLSEGGAEAAYISTVKDYEGSAVGYLLIMWTDSDPDNYNAQAESAKEHVQDTLLRISRSVTLTEPGPIVKLLKKIM